MQHKTTSAVRILLAAANLIIPVAIFIFATGFFPYKPFLAGLAQYDDTHYGTPPAAPFDRLVFMVVDALRSDFVFAEGSGFRFTQRLIKNGSAIPFTAHAASPTVTMPRLKAITTGSIPSFLDVILNLDEADSSSTLASQDTWLAQMKAKNTGKLVMYGDDTWLKLFPGTFDRAEGTSSFFVSDFTEVDNNVTRHIDSELRLDDWNTMVLHYLGLDHIGHKSGPRSSNMVPKQQEMDGIVRRIYEAMESQPHMHSTLLVLCGDHGMNDAGNHGASSAGETSPALVFVSPKLKPISALLEVPAPHAEDFQYYSLVEQSDLAPTLGALLGFPVPKNNLGAVIPEFLPLWTEWGDRANILMHNAKQIFGIVVAASGNVLKAKDHSGLDCSQLSLSTDILTCQWHDLAEAYQRGIWQSANGDAWDEATVRWLRASQSLMSSMASNYDTNRLTLGLVAALLSASLSLLASTFVVKRVDGTLVWFATILLLYGFMMFASSYVEEEHHFWYWLTTAWLTYLSGASSRKLVPATFCAAAVALVSLRLIRGWNQTGQKFAGSPDIVKGFLLLYPQLLWCLIWGTYLMVTIELMSNVRAIPSAIAKPLIIGLVGSAMSFKLAFANEDAPEIVVGFAHSLMRYNAGPSLLGRAQIVFIGLAVASTYPVYLLIVHNGRSNYRAIKTLHGLYTLFALTQSRATSIPLFLLFRVLQAYLEFLELGIVEITASSLLLQFSSFFAMGGTNAISSVDLSNAYNGVSGFNVFAVGVLTFVSNWAAPIWWTSATCLLLLQYRLRGGHQGLMSHLTLLTVFVATNLCFVMAACAALRTHLFIWTVFSPKYLYSMAWSLGQHLTVNVAIGGLLYRLGSRGSDKNGAIAV